VNRTFVPDTEEETRRWKLRRFALAQSGERNKCLILVSIVEVAVRLVTGSRTPAETLINDLQAVLVGNGLRFGRGKGKDFVGMKFIKDTMGSEGFRPELRDDFSQIQHAVGGLIIGYRYNRRGMPVYQVARWNEILIERQPQDARLYDATCIIGRNLNDQNYSRLPSLLRDAIGNAASRGAGDYPIPWKGKERMTSDF
jgi:hypothetical protein